jgi:hypothetical protein
MVPRYKWFPDTNGSQVQMVPRYTWFPGTNGSQVQMQWFPCLNGPFYYLQIREIMTLQKCFTQKSLGINNFKTIQFFFKYKNIVKLLTVNCSNKSEQELQIKNCKSRIASQELRVKNCKSRIASQELQVKNCKSRIASQELQVKKLQVKNCKSRIY